MVFGLGVIVGTAGAATPVVVAAGSAATTTGAAVATTSAAAVATGAAGGTVAGPIIATGAALGPVGWLLLGASSENRVSFDCWKQIVRESDPVPSRGIILNHLLSRPEIANLKMNGDSVEIINVWNEKFLISQVYVPSHEMMALHAIRVC